VNPYYEKVDVLGISVKVKVKDKDAPVLNLAPCHEDISCSHLCHIKYDRQ